MQTVPQHMTINCYQSEVTFLGFVLFRLFFFRTLHSSFQSLQIKLSFLNCNKKNCFLKDLFCVLSLIVYVNTNKVMKVQPYSKWVLTRIIKF